MEIGMHNVEIVENGLTSIAGKPCAKIIVKFDNDETTDVLIWMTAKSAGIARQQLKACGFDVDGEDLYVLADDPTRLAGKKIEVMVDSWNGNLRAQIPLNTTVSRDEAVKLQGLLREVKKSNKAATASAALPDDDPNFPF